MADKSVGSRGKRARLFKPKEDPLTYAAQSRDKSVIEMVERAIRHKEVVLAFQPVVEARSRGKVAFYEGLIRVLDDTGRVIPAREFIAEIETSETGRLLDCLSLELGLRNLAAHPDLRLAINLSARSIGYGRWNKVLKNGLGNDPTVGERLILEINENSAMHVPDLVAGFMSDLQSKGVSFALDDFGAGMTSFKHLKEFYFDIIKIDGQFIRGISDNPDNQVLTAAMAAVAEQFDLITIAENVERQQDAEFLTRLGIDCLQGYCFGAPTVNPPWRRPLRHKRSA